MPDSTRPTPDASANASSEGAPSDEQPDKKPASARLRLEVDVLKGERDASENAPSASDPSARGALCALLVLVLAALFGCAAPAAHAQSASPLSGDRPLAYVPNHGQWDADVLYQARGGGFTAWVTRNGLTYDFVQPSASDSAARRGHVVRMAFESGAATHAVPHERLPGVHNYYRGPNPQHWIEGVPRYRDVRLQDLYPGIALRLYEEDGLPRYDLIAEPGVDVAQAAFRLEGAEDVRVTPSGELAFQTSVGEIRQADLVAYQEVNGERVRIDAAFAVRADGRVGFDVDVPYPHLAVVIDPLIYSTFLNGSLEEDAVDIAVENGAVYVTGTTQSDDFPTTTGAYQETGDSEVPNETFITRLAADGSSLVYSTYLSGGTNVLVEALAVEEGAAYVTGVTGSGFPTTSGAFQTTYGNAGDSGGSLGLGAGGDAFVTKLAPDGGSLVYSTYLGANGSEVGSGIAVEDGRVYVAGSVAIEEADTLPGGGFPTTPGAFQTAHGNDNTSTSFGFLTWSDVFVTQLAADGGSLVYSTFLGGGGIETGSGLAVEDGQACITGSVTPLESPSYPTTSGAFNETYNGGDYDAMVTCLDPDGSRLAYSTYLGGSGREETTDISLEDGHAYVTGILVDPDTGFPTTPGAFDETANGSLDLFITKLTVGGSGLAYSTLLGGTDDDEVDHANLAVERGTAYVTGTTLSTDFPTTDDAFQGAFGADDFAKAFVTQIAPGGGELAYSSYFGGVATFGAAIAVEDANVFITGRTSNRDFPTTPGAFDETGQSGDFVLANAYVTGFDLAFADPVVTKPTDSGLGSLREALQITGSGATLTFDPVLDGQTIPLSSGQLVLDKSITIDASGLADGITISGGGAQRVFSVADDETVTLRALTIADGNASSGAGLINRGNLTLDGVTVTGNATTGNLGTGGGMRNRVGATLTLRNSTLSGNAAPGGDGNGGGIYNDGTVVLTNSTLFGNSAGASGGGILNLGALTLQSSVIAGSTGGDCAGGSVTESRSLVEDGSCGATLSGDPLLGALADNGGPAATHRPDAFSPLVDAGACNGLSADQRGEQRPVEANARPTAVDGCDIGAVELGASELPFRRYVDADATGAGDGSSWTDAFSDLQDALAEADDNDQIWVAAGTYTPTEGTDRTVSFRVTGAQDGLRIYGGFAGTETRLDQRDLSASETVLSGDIDTPGDPSDNSYHVLVFDGTTGGPLTPATILADVTITGGNADGTSPSNRGGGFYCIGNGTGNACSPTLTRLVFDGNRATAGGAIYNFGEGGESSPQIIGSVFVNNQATAFGGAILANGNNGGTSSPVILSSTFARNASDTRGGALYNSGSSGTSTPTVTNSILYGNTAPDGAAVYNFSGSATLAHTLIEGGVNGAGVAGDANIDGGATVDADPLFVDANLPAGPDGMFGTVDDGLQVQPGSLVLDAGDTAALPPDLTADLTGGDRVRDNDGNPETPAQVDLGAYEAPGDTVLPVELAAFTATQQNGGITLSWQTASEINNTGFAVQRAVVQTSRRNVSTAAPMDWESVGFVEGAGTTTEAQTYRFRDATPPFADALAYRLKQIDTDGTSELSPEVVVHRGPGTEVQLVAPFPNPVRQQATVRYVVPDGSAQPVRLTVYNVLGQRVATLVDATKAPGREELLLDASRWPSGMYVLRLRVGETMRTERVTVVR